MNQEETIQPREELIEHTTAIVSAHVANNAISGGDLPGLIKDIYQTLSTLQSDQAAKPAPVPAVPIKRSVKPDYIICLEDGRQLKTLKRHLRTRYGMTPEEYRDKWGLPSDYPMVAPNYARQRSDLAKQLGLGRQPRQDAEPAQAAPVSAPAATKASGAAGGAKAKKAPARGGAKGGTAKRSTKTGSKQART